MPSLISNQWWLRCDGCIWTAWHIRWAWETGLYALYFNLPETPDRGLVKNTKEAGEHFGKFATSGVESNALIEDAPPAGWGERLPAWHDLDLYDFHFRRVASSHAIAQHRPWVFSAMRASNLTCLWMGKPFLSI